MKSVSHSPSIFSVFLCYAALLQVVVASSWVRYNVKPSENVGRRYTDALQGQDDTFDSLIALVGATATVNQKASSSDFETLFLNKNGVTAVASNFRSKGKGSKNNSRASAPPTTGCSSDTIPNSESVASRLSELYEDFTARHFIVHLPVFIEKFVKTIYGVHVESVVEGRSHLFDQIKAFKIVFVNGQFSVHIYLDVTWRSEPNISELLPFDDEVSAFFVSANSALFLESRKGFRVIAQSLDSSFKATVSPSTAATAAIVTESTPTAAVVIPLADRKLSVEEADEEAAQRGRDLIAQEEAENAKRDLKAQTKKAREEETKKKKKQQERQHRINQEKAEREEKARIAEDARKEAEAQRLEALKENEIKKEADRVNAEFKRRQEQEAELKRKQEQEAERKRQKAEHKKQQVERKRQEVERKRQEAELKRQEAELKRQEEEEAELQKQQAELKKQEIERKRQEEEEEEAELQRQAIERKRQEDERKRQEIERKKQQAEFNRQSEIRKKEKAQRQAEEALKAARQAELQAQADRQREGAEIKKMSAEDSHSSVIRSVTQAEEKVRKLQEEAERMTRELNAAHAFILEQQKAQAQAASQQAAQTVSQQNVINSPEQLYQHHALDFPTLMTDNISSFGAPGSAKSTSSKSPGVIGDSKSSNDSIGGPKFSGDNNARLSLVTDFFGQQLCSSSLNTPEDNFFGFQQHQQFPPTSAFNSPEYDVLSALGSGGSETKSQQLEQEQKKSHISFIDSILSDFESSIDLTDEDGLHSGFETLSPHLNTQAEAFIPGFNWSPTSANNEQPANTMLGNVDSYPAPLMVHDQYMMQQTPQFFGQQGTFIPQPAANRQPVYDHYGALQQSLPTRVYNQYSPRSHFQQPQQQMQHSYEFYQQQQLLQQQQQQSLTPPGFGPQQSQYAPGFSPQRQQQQQRHNPYNPSQQQQPNQYMNQLGKGPRSFGY